MHTTNGGKLRGTVLNPKYPYIDSRLFMLLYSTLADAPVSIFVTRLRKQPKYISVSVTFFLKSIGKLGF